MNEIGKCAVEKETKLSDLMGRMSDMSHDLSDARNRLNCLSDRLLGCMPEVDTESGKTPPREGAIGQLEDCVDNLKLKIVEIIKTINRIQDSGVV